MARHEAAAVGPIPKIASLSGSKGSAQVTVGGSRRLRALSQRLGAVAPVLLDRSSHQEPDLPADPAELLEVLVRSLQPRVDAHAVWLLLVGLTATFPRPDEVRTTRRHLEHLAPRDAVLWLLEEASRRMSIADAEAEIELVTGLPIVDVDFSARNDLSTGIQRVVRQLVPRWSRAHSLTLVRWINAR